MSDSIEKTAELSTDSGRRRDCLCCSAPFHSTWAGERVCPRCKGSSKWRSGSGMETRRSQSRSTPSGRS